MDLDSFPEEESPTQTGENSNAQSPVSSHSPSSLNERLADRYPSDFPVYLHWPGIPPAETERLTRILQRLITNCISRQTDRQRARALAQASAQAPTQDSNGQGEASGSEAYRPPSREQLNALLGYEMAYSDLLKTIPPDSSDDSVPPSSSDPITRLAYLETMMEHYAALDSSFIWPTCRLVPDRSVFREALTCMWNVIHEGNMDALNRLHAILTQS